MFGSKRLLCKSKENRNWIPNGNCSSPVVVEVFANAVCIDNNTNVSTAPPLLVVILDVYSECSITLVDCSFLMFGQQQGYPNKLLQSMLIYD